MKNIKILGVALVLLFILLGSGVNTAKATDGTVSAATAAGCTAGARFSTTTGQPCTEVISTNNGCQPGFAFSPITGQSCLGSGGSSNNGGATVQTLVLDRVISVGMRGGDVMEVQQFLKDQGYYTGKVDGVYGPVSARSVRYFQEDYNLTTNGRVDAQTLARMNLILSGPGEVYCENDNSCLDTEYLPEPCPLVSNNGVASHQCDDTFKVSPVSGRAPMTVTATFDGCYFLDWGDGEIIEPIYTMLTCGAGISESQHPILSRVHTYNTDGTYKVSLYKNSNQLLKTVIITVNSDSVYNPNSKKLSFDSLIGSKELKAGEQGSWTIKVSTNTTPSDVYVTAYWGDEKVGKTETKKVSVPWNQENATATATATFYHTYLLAGNYSPTFTAKTTIVSPCQIPPCRETSDTIKSALSVNVNGSTALPYINILSPNGGEIFSQGESAVIEVDKGNSTISSLGLGLVSADSTLENNRLIGWIYGGTPASKGGIQWDTKTICKGHSDGMGVECSVAFPGTYKIFASAYVQGSNKHVSDISDNYFTITSNNDGENYPSMTLYEPQIKGYSVAQNGVTAPVTGSLDTTWCKTENPNASGNGPFEFNWGDGSKSCSWFPAEHTYSQPGQYSVEVRVKNTSGRIASRTNTFNVEKTPSFSITTSTLSNATVGTAYSANINATGGDASYVWSLTSGSLPPGITEVTTTACRGGACKLPLSLGGIPTTPGTYTFTYQVRSGSIYIASKSFTIVVEPKIYYLSNIVGYADEISCSLIGGWALNLKDTSSSMSVNVYDESNGYRKLLSRLETTGWRTDVNTQYAIVGLHGYGLDTPSSVKDGRTHTISVMGIDANSGIETQLTNSPKTITCSVASRVSPNLSASALGGLASTNTDTSTPAQVSPSSYHFTGYLEQGSRGTEVSELQKVLNNAGYNVGAVDGVFGPKVKEALMSFQKANGLKADGIFGYEMRTFLNK